MKAGAQMVDMVGMRCCDIEIWPQYEGSDSVTLGVIEIVNGRADESIDLLVVTLSTDEAIALADILLSAARSKTDTPTYALRSLRIRDV
jgi:hypothetical protein